MEQAPQTNKQTGQGTGLYSDLSPRPLFLATHSYMLRAVKVTRLGTQTRLAQVTHQKVWTEPLGPDLPPLCLVGQCAREC